MTRDEATILYEDVLDTLTEVGNGATDAMLHEALTKLFRIRDEYLVPNRALVYFKTVEEFEDEKRKEEEFEDEKRKEAVRAVPGQPGDAGTGAPKGRRNSVS